MLLYLVKIKNTRQGHVTLYILQGLYFSIVHSYEPRVDHCRKAVSVLFYSEGTSISLLARVDICIDIGCIFGIGLQYIKDMRQNLSWQFKMGIYIKYENGLHNWIMP